MPVTNPNLLFSLSKEEEEKEERNRSGGYKKPSSSSCSFSRERYFSLSLFLSPGDERVRSQSVGFSLRKMEKFLSLLFFSQLSRVSHFLSQFLATKRRKKRRKECDARLKRERESTRKKGHTRKRPRREKKRASARERRERRKEVSLSLL